MSDEVKKEAPPAEDPIKNLKAEFDRKLGNIEKTNQQLLSTLQTLATPKKEDPKPKTAIKDIWYDDPEAAARLVAQNASEHTMNQIRQEQAIQNKKGTVIQQLYREYPELQDFDNPLTTKAVEIFEKLTDEEKGNPIAYRLAVKEAADELDIKPKAKRKAKEDDDDSFSLSGGKGGGSSQRARGKKGELDPKTVEFAKLVGLDPDNEKTSANLKKHAERKNWLTWE